MQGGEKGERYGNKARLLLWLAGINLYISTFTFGGGYVVVPMIRKYYVGKKRVFSEDELMEMAAISQSTPGAIAVNLAALAGYRAAGRAGLFVSCVCAVLPPLIILAAVSAFYGAVISNALVVSILRGMQAGVAAFIVDFVVDMAGKIVKERSFLLFMIMAASFLVSFLTELNLVLILAGSCLICALRTWKKRRA